MRLMTGWTIGLLWGATLLSTAHIATDPTSDWPDNWYLVENPKAHDADTIKGDVDLGLGVVLKDQGLRPDDYDAWEVSTLRERGNSRIHVSPEEIVKGKKALKEFNELIATGKLYVHPNPKRPREKYGRILGPWKIVRGNEVIRVAKYAEDHGWNRSEVFELEQD